LPARSVAIIHDRSQYGKGLADVTRDELHRRNINEAIYEAITQGDRDFSALISRMKAARVEVIYFGGYHTEAALCCASRASRASTPCCSRATRW
jgi:branched-chain amino acid transport system substrate-binding protein